MPRPYDYFIDTLDPLCEGAALADWGAARPKFYEFRRAITDRPYKHAYPVSGFDKKCIAGSPHFYPPNLSKVLRLSRKNDKINYYAKLCASNGGY